jgi:hypothetical protein
MKCINKFTKIPLHVARRSIPRIDSSGHPLLYCHLVPAIGKLHRNQVSSGEWNCRLGRTVRNVVRMTELSEDPLKEVHDYGGSTFEPAVVKTYIL